MTSHKFWDSVIEKVKDELKLYGGKNIKPSLRQMFYRLLNRKTYDNTDSSYKQLSAKSARARETGVLPIDCFYDESPIINIDDEYVSPEETIDEIIQLLKDLPKNYGGLPRWYNQPDYVEKWIEKNAMVSEFESIINEAGLEVRLVPHGGYVSLTQLNDSVNRIFSVIKEGKTRIHILYYGDFDPSGVQMFEDIKTRLVKIWGLENGNFRIEMEGKKYNFSFDIQRVAVNKEHIIEYDLPKDPQSKKEEIKLENDTRTRKFIKAHGRVYATEVDSFPVWAPDAFKELVVNSVNQYFNQEIYDREVTAHTKEHSEEAIKVLVKKKVDELAGEL